MDKQLTPYQRTPRWNWRTLPDCSESQSQNVQTYWYVFHDTNGLNHGQTLKIQWYLSNEICMDTHLQDCCGKDSLKKLCWNLGGESPELGMSFLFIENKDFSYRYTWMTSKLLNGSRIRPPCGRNWWKTLILMNPHHFLDHENLGCTQRECKPNDWVQRGGEISRKNSLVVQRHGRACSKMCWEILRAGKRKKWSSCRKFQVPVWMITNSRRKNLNQLENYQKYAYKLSWHACTWHELEDQTFNGLSTNLQEQSQNGVSLATDVWQDWFHTFITHMTTDNIVTWATRLSIVDWVYSKTKTLLATLWIHNQPRRVLCIFGSRTFVPKSLMCKKQRSTESEAVSLDASLRIDGILALDLWDVVI